MADRRDNDSSDSEDEQASSPSEDSVVTKYKQAGGIVNGVLAEVVARCVPGASVGDVCAFGDNRLIEETDKIFKKSKEIKKGIAFPTCLSVNNCICHYSPLKSEESPQIADGDLVKIDLGAHVDGFIAVVAQSIVVGASKENKVEGRKADVMNAANSSAEIALRLIKPGNNNYTVTDTLKRAAEEFQCQPVEGMLSHEMRRHIIDGEKAIILNPTDQQRKDHVSNDFEVHEVYAVDVLVSTGDGKSRELETRTTVYKKKDVIYQLKMKMSRQLLSEVEKRFQLMPFTLRLLEDESKAKMGIKECVKHDLMTPYNVLYEKQGEFVAQFKFTMLLMPNGPIKVTDYKFDPDCYKSEYSLKDEQLKTLSTESISRKQAKRKKKIANKAVADEMKQEGDKEKSSGKQDNKENKTGNTEKAGNKEKTGSKESGGKASGGKVKTENKDKVVVGES